MNQPQIVDEELITVSPQRIRRVVEALSAVSIGDFTSERCRIEAEQDDAFGEIESILGVLVGDLGEVLSANDSYMKEIERAARDAEQRLETIERQQDAISELSTPIIEIWDDVLTLPIIGVVDTRRSVDMTERLLFQIAERRAQCVIIDITGVDVVDTMTADHFVKMIRAAGMLGAFCVVSGITPEVAQTLVRTGVELEGVRTVRSLKDALKRCFVHLSSQRKTKETGP